MENHVMNCNFGDENEELMCSVGGNMTVSEQLNTL